MQEEIDLRFVEVVDIWLREMTKSGKRKAATPLRETRKGKEAKRIEEEEPRLMGAPLIPRRLSPIIQGRQCQGQIEEEPQDNEV